MKLGKQISILTLLCALTFAAAGTSFAVGPDDDYDDNLYGPQLSQEQMAQARKIFNDNYASMEATRKALTAKRAELDAQLASPTPDKAKIESLSREIGELRGKILSSRVEVRTQLEKQGLPSDFYGPAPAPRNDFRRGDFRHHHGRRGHGCPWRGMYGCM